MFTSGFNFEGYHITKYYGVFTGEAVIGTGPISELKAELGQMCLVLIIKRFVIN